MKRPYFLILIFGTILFLFFQNFTVPNRVLPVERKFDSKETNPTKRLRDFVKFQIGEEASNTLEDLKSKLRIDWGGRAPAEEPMAQEPVEKVPVDYALANFRTVRIRDDDKEVNCRVDSKGLNIVFQQKLSSTSSYIIEHNTEQQKSQAKFQITW